MGHFLGKGGLTLQQIRNRTSCRIEIPVKTDPGPHPTTRRVTLIGTEKSVARAKLCINMMVADDHDDDNLGGNGAGGGGPSQFELLNRSPVPQVVSTNECVVSTRFAFRGAVVRS